MKLSLDTLSAKIGKKIDVNTIEDLTLDSLGFTELPSLVRLKCLKKLDLSGNRFQLIRHIKGLFDLTVIEDLNLTGNPVTKQNNYRLIVIQNLPTLLILDEKKITATERNQARDFDESTQVKDPLKKATNIDSDDEVDVKVVANNIKKEEESPIKKTVVNNVEKDEEESKKLDEDSLFKSSNTKKKLIFEEDEEISLDSINLSTLEKKVVEKKQPKTILFEDDEDDEELFGKGSRQVKPTTKKPIDDDLFDDDDLFGNTKKDSNSNLSSDFDISSYINSQKTRGKSSLFDD